MSEEQKKILNEISLVKNFLENGDPSVLSKANPLIVYLSHEALKNYIIDMEESLISLAKDERLIEVLKTGDLNELKFYSNDMFTKEFLIDITVPGKSCIVKERMTAYETFFFYRNKSFSTEEREFFISLSLDLLNINPSKAFEIFTVYQYRIPEISQRLDGLVGYQDKPEYKQFLVEEIVKAFNQSDFHKLGKLLKLDIIKIDHYYNDLTNLCNLSLDIDTSPQGTLLQVSKYAEMTEMTQFLESKGATK